MKFAKLRLVGNRLFEDTGEVSNRTRSYELGEKYNGRLYEEGTEPSLQNHRITVWRGSFWEVCVEGRLVLLSVQGGRLVKIVKLGPKTEPVFTSRATGEYVRESDHAPMGYPDTEQGRKAWEDSVRVEKVE
ncbi:MAG: hypothetical protein HYT63_00470 [Candidatus Yanofskybacteria bacterium]|nr:hypothetical protein [Candidatus Yanofskybacteria bacterium]